MEFYYLQNHCFTFLVLNFWPNVNNIKVVREQHKSSSWTRWCSTQSICVYTSYRKPTQAWYVKGIYWNWKYMFKIRLFILRDLILTFCVYKITISGHSCLNPLPDMPILGSSNSAANKDMMSKLWANGHAIVWLSRKYCGKRRNCSLWAISPFPTMFSKAVWYWCFKMSICGVKG